MDLTPYADRLREEVAAATQLGGPDSTAAAERLLIALDPAVRLVLIEMLADAVAQISTELPSGAVELRVRGRELQFLVEGLLPLAEPLPAGSAEAATPIPAIETEGGQVRITLRLPDTVKARAEERAAERGQSLNSWLVDAVRMATGEAWPAVRREPGRGGWDAGRRGPHRRITGWA